jgi:hypothetical protein
MTTKTISDDEWRWGTPDHPAVGVDPEAWFRAVQTHPSARGRTHYQGCFQWHAACAYAVGTAQRDDARGLAVRLEQELVETQKRCTALISEWTRTGSMSHAAQLADALELPDDLGGVL